MVVALRRLSPSQPRDVLAFKAAFRGAPSYVYATGGEVPTDADIERMMNTLPSGYRAEDMFIYEVAHDDAPCGCAFLARGYPKPSTAYIVLLLIAESAQGKGLGQHALRQLELTARSWGCTRLEAVVDSENGRALKFWLREGFVETRRGRLSAFVGDAVSVEKNVS